MLTNAQNASDMYSEVYALKEKVGLLQHVTVYSQVVPGDYKYSARTADFHGWMVCDGRSLNKNTYNALFQVIGTSFGGSGNSFNLPDFRGRVPGAIGSGVGLTTRAIGAVVGAETHTLIVNEIPSHNHGVTDPGHTHSYVSNTNDQNTDNAFNSETAADNADLGATTGSSTTGITINNTGGGLPHNNMQPTLFGGNVFIFAGV